MNFQWGGWSRSTQAGVGGVEALEVTRGESKCVAKKKFAMTFGCG